MRTAAATGPEARLTKPAINPRQIINCALSILSIVRLRPNFLEKWDKGPSVAADCTISFYFWFTRSVGDLSIIQHVVDTAIEGSSCVTTLNLIQVKFVYPSYHEWAQAPQGAIIAMTVMSALGQKQTWQCILLMSALPPKADIGT